MSRPVLAEWSGEELVYLGPRETVNKFGHPAPSQRPDITPEEMRLFARIEERVALQDGEVAAEKELFPGVAEASAARAKELGAELVGIACVDPHYVYAGVDLSHAYAVCFAIAMEYDEILRVPRSPRVRS